MQRLHLVLSCVTVLACPHDLHPSVDLSFSTVLLHVVLGLPRFLFKSSPIGVSSYSVDSAYVMSVVCCVFHMVNNDLDHRTIHSTTGKFDF